jgi:hypothetical protein
MAITAAACQAELGTNPNNAQVMQLQMPLTGTTQHWYVVGNQDARGGRGGVRRRRRIMRRRRQRVS